MKPRLVGEDCWLGKEIRALRYGFRSWAMIDCHKCKYYYVTWEKEFPHGCRAMSFKSRHLPSFVVRTSNQGVECLAFEEKAAIADSITDSQRKVR
jgi:hypothetical protein